MEVHSLHRRTLHCTGEVLQELTRLHELQLSSFDWLDSNMGGGDSIAFTGADGGAADERDSRARGVQRDGVAKRMAVTMGSKHVVCEIAPLVGAAAQYAPGEEHDAREERQHQPPTADALMSSDALVSWLRRATAYQTVRLQQEEKEQEQQYALAAASLLSSSTLRSQVLSLPRVVQLELLSGLLLALAFVTDAIVLFVAAAEEEALARRACVFIGLVQLCWVFIFFYFLLVGIWLENSFEMDTAAFMLIVLVATGVDKQVWACRVRNLRGEGGQCWKWTSGVYGDGASECLTITNASSYDAAPNTTQFDCCGPDSIASNCAAETQANLTWLILLNPIPYVVVLLLFLLCNFFARRSFGWRFFNVSGYDLAHRQQMMRSIKFGVYVSADMFVNLIWHAVLLYWVVVALSRGWNPLWAIVAVSAFALNLATTALCAHAARHHRVRSGYVAMGCGLANLVSSTIACGVLATVGSVRTELMPDPDWRFAFKWGVPSMAMRLGLLLGIGLWIRLSREYVGLMDKAGAKLELQPRDSTKANWPGARKAMKTQGGGGGGGGGGRSDADGGKSEAGGAERETYKSQLPAEMAMNVTESEAQALVHMLGGQDLLLSATGQKPKPHYLQLSADFSVLRWSWKGYVLMNEVAGLQLSRHPNYSTPCITLVLSHDDKAQRAPLDLVCLDARVSRYWTLGLRTLLRLQANSMHRLPTDLVAFVQSAFRASDTTSAGLLAAPQLIDCFVRLNAQKTQEWAARNVARSSRGAKGLNFHQTLQCFMDEVAEEQVGAIFKKYADVGLEESRTMTCEAYYAFLEEEQRVTRHEDQLRLWQHASRHGRATDAGTGALNEKAFAAALFSPQNDAVDPAVYELADDMSLPLNAYFVSSSHNSYLEGNQLTSKSSVAMYRRHYLMGFRCVELDCWDGGDGDPVITHGHTITTSIKFRDVIQATMDTGFLASPYAITLSLEMHCSIEQQEEIVRILKEVCGDALIPPDWADDARDIVLPSPHETRHKVIVKAKKRRPGPHERHLVAAQGSLAHAVQPSSGVGAGACSADRSDTRLRQRGLARLRAIAQDGRLDTYNLAHAADGGAAVSAADKVGLLSQIAVKQSRQTRGTGDWRGKSADAAGGSADGGRRDSASRGSARSIFSADEEESQSHAFLRDQGLTGSSSSEALDLAVSAAALRASEEAHRRAVDARKSWAAAADQMLSDDDDDDDDDSSASSAQDDGEEKLEASRAQHHKETRAETRKGKDVRKGSLLGGGGGGTPRKKGGGGGDKPHHDNKPHHIQGLVGDVIELEHKIESKIHNLTGGHGIGHGVGHSLVDRARGASGKLKLGSNPGGTSKETRDKSHAGGPKNRKAPDHSSDEEGGGAAATAAAAAGGGGAAGKKKMSCMGEGAGKKGSLASSASDNEGSTRESFGDDLSSTSQISQVRQLHEMSSEGSRLNTSSSTLCAQAGAGGTGLGTKRPKSRKRSKKSAKDGGVDLPKSKLPWSPKLSDVTYLPSIKFKGTKRAGTFATPYEITSISESKTLDMYKSTPAEMLEHNLGQITRIYPDGYRQDSSNMDPTPMWTMGCNMVCINVQTWDLGMRLNHAKFRLNGGCGYVLKPLWMREARWGGENLPPLDNPAGTPGGTPGAAGRVGPDGAVVSKKASRLRGLESAEAPAADPDGSTRHLVGLVGLGANAPSPDGAVATTLGGGGGSMHGLSSASCTAAASSAGESLRQVTVRAAPQTRPPRQSVLASTVKGATELISSTMSATTGGGGLGNGKTAQRSSVKDLVPEQLASYDLVHLHLVCGRDLPKAGEQRCVPEQYDRYCPASKFVRKPPSNKASSVSSPYVVLEVHGGGRFRCAVKEGAPLTHDAVYTSETVHHNGLHPRWDEHVALAAEHADDALISLHLYSRASGSDVLLAYEVLPMHALREGLRVVRLRSQTGSMLQFGAMLVRLRCEKRTGVIGLRALDGSAPSSHGGGGGGKGSIDAGSSPSKAGGGRCYAKANALGELRLTMSDTAVAVNAAAHFGSGSVKEEHWGGTARDGDGGGGGGGGVPSGSERTSVGKRGVGERATCKGSSNNAPQPPRKETRGSINLQTLTVDADAAATDLMNTIVLLRTDAAAEELDATYDVNPLRGELFVHVKEVATRLRLPVAEGWPLEFEVGNALHHRASAGVGVWFEAGVLAQYYVQEFERGGLRVHGEDFRVVKAREFYTELHQAVQGGALKALQELEC